MARTPMSSATGERFEFSVRVTTAGIGGLYPKVRMALLDVGYQLAETVDVMKALERLIAMSVERDAKRLQVRMHALQRRTHIKVIDRRRLNPQMILPAEIVPREIARASSARPASDGPGLTLWAIVDRLPPSDGPPALSPVVPARGNAPETD
jgi:hypothetical protein